MGFVVYKVYQTNYILPCWYSDRFNLLSESIISPLWLTEKLFTKRVPLENIDFLSLFKFYIHFLLLMLPEEPLLENINWLFMSAFVLLPPLKGRAMTFWCSAHHRYPLYAVLWAVCCCLHLPPLAEQRAVNGISWHDMCLRACSYMRACVCESICVCM